MKYLIVNQNNGANSEVSDLDTIKQFVELYESGIYHVKHVKKQETIKLEEMVKIRGLEVGQMLRNDKYLIIRLKD